MKKILALAILAGIAVGIYFAVKTLPWWVLILAAVAVVVVGKFVLGRLIKTLLTMPFKAKGAVLRGAKAQVHGVVPLTSNGQSSGARARYQVDVTITPGSISNGPFQHWAPGELTLVPPQSKIDLDDSSSEDDVCELEKVEVEHDGRFHEDEGLKYAGPQKLKLSVAVVPGTKVLKFRYYFEEFGQVWFPEAEAKAA
jgi:hypothetical protein